MDLAASASYLLWKGLSPWHSFKLAVSMHSQWQWGREQQEAPWGVTWVTCVLHSLSPRVSAAPSLLLIRTDSPAVTVSPLLTCCSLDVRSPKDPGSSHTCCVLWQECTPWGDPVLQPSLAQHRRVRRHQILQRGFGGSLGVIMPGATSAATPRFPDSCTLHRTTWRSPVRCPYRTTKDRTPSFQCFPARALPL